MDSSVESNEGTCTGSASTTHNPLEISLKRSKPLKVCPENKRIADKLEAGDEQMRVRIVASFQEKPIQKELALQRVHLDQKSCQDNFAADRNVRYVFRAMLD